jgi:hypothetical protein
MVLRGLLKLLGLMGIFSIITWDGHDGTFI